MNKKIIILCFIISMVKMNKLFSQTTYTLDYTTLNVTGVGSRTCNFFGVPTTVNGYLHQSSIGYLPVSFYYSNGNVIDVLLASVATDRFFDCPGNPGGQCQTNIDNQGRQMWMTQYGIAFPFKVGYQYKISIYGRGGADLGSDIGLTFSTNNGGVSGVPPYNPNGSCPDQPNSSLQDTSIRSNYTLTTLPGNANDTWIPVFDHIATQNFSYLLIAGLARRIYYRTSFTAYVQKVQIIESLPEADCSINPLINHGIISSDITGATITVNSYSGTGASGSTPVTVSPNGGTWLVAGNTIFLQSEFKVQSPIGSNFVAKIAPCRPIPRYASMDPVYGDSSEKETNDLLGTNEVKIYPTPSSGVLKIKFGRLDLINRVTLNIYNQLGMEVYKSTYEKLNYHIIQLNLKNLTSGVYFVKITAANKITTKKIIINK